MAGFRREASWAVLGAEVMDLGAEEDAWGSLGLITLGLLQSWSREKAWREMGSGGD